MPRFASYLTAILATAAAAHATAAPTTPSTNTTTYLRSPLLFEDLRADRAGAAFRTFGAGYATWLSGNQAVFELRRGQLTHVVRMELVGADASARAEAAGPARTAVRRYVGADPRAWTSHGTYDRVAFHDVYPGIDAAYYGTQGQLEYDLDVAPGADPRQIELRFAGADRVTRDVDGSLVVSAGDIDLRLRAPLAYQGEGPTRQVVPSSFVVTPTPDGGTVARITLGTYDASRRLVIDPVVDYAAYLSGSAADRAYAIAADSTGNAVVTGFTASTNFPSTLGAVFAGSQDAFVTRIDAGGAALTFSTLLGGSAYDVGKAVALDGTGNIYVAGTTSSLNFPTTAGAYDVVANGNNDVFVAKLTSTGALTYATFVGGSGNDEPDAIAVDNLNRPYVVGKTEGGATAFPTPTGYDVTFNGGSWDAFALRLAANFATLNYSTYLGGTSFDYGQGIALDGYKAIVVGYTTSTLFPTIGAQLRVGYGGSGDGFIAKLAADGLSLVSSSYLGGSTTDSLEAVTIGGQGNVFVTGWTSTTLGVTPAYPTTTGSFGTLGAGGTDVVVTKLDAALATIQYSGVAGGSANDYGYGVVVTAGGAAVVVGLTASGNFPQVASTQATGFGGGSYDAFILKLTSAGSSMAYASYLGGAGADSATGVALDGTARAYLCGEAGAGFPVMGTLGVTALGANEAMVARISP